jgi:aspartate aminotransferase-like enzyme
MHTYSNRPAGVSSAQAAAARVALIRNSRRPVRARQQDVRMAPLSSTSPDDVRAPTKSDFSTFPQLVDRALLDTPVLGAARFAAIEDRSAAVLGIERDLVHLQGEAIIALEAMARGIGAPGRVCLNLVTGPYGMELGDWLTEAGSEVIELKVPFDRAVTVQETADALAARPDISVVVMVHAEAATGVVNPLAEIAALAKEHGAIIMVDAVASAGGHAVPVDELDLDLCAFGPQKALAGPANVSLVSVSPRGWELLAENPAPWRNSSLSLLDWKERWIDTGRTAFPGTPAALDWFALESSMARLGDEGLDAAIARHERASTACRAGVRAMGLEPFAIADDEATTLCTTIRLPDGVDPAQLLAFARGRFGVPLLGGAGPLFTELTRIDHMGQGAQPAVIIAALAAVGAGMEAQGVSVDIGAGLAAAVAVLA